MPESYPRHMAHAAPEDELIRLEEAYAEIEERRRRTPPTESMRRIRVTAPTGEPHLTAGEPT